MFITLHRVGHLAGDEIDVNPDAIMTLAVGINGDGSIVAIVGGAAYYVAESRSTIRAMIADMTGQIARLAEAVERLAEAYEEAHK